MSRPATGVPVNEARNVIPGKVINSGSATIQDLPFAVAFLITVAGVATTAFAMPHFRNAIAGADKEIATVQHAAEHAVPLDYTLIVQVALATATVSTVFFSSCWLLMMRAHAKFLVTAALIIPVVLFVALTLWSAYMLIIVGVGYDTQRSITFAGVCGLIGAVFSLLWLQSMWEKIPATAHALSLSSHVIFTLPGTVFVAFTTAVVQVGWFGVASVAFVNVYTELAPSEEEVEAGEGSGALGVAMVSLLLALYWGWQVFSNVAYVTTCGSVASWYFYPASVEKGCACFKPVVWEALGRACTASFGSICAGSLLVAIVQTIGAILRHIELKAREEGNLAFILIACCFRCAFSFLEALLEMFNEWAYVYVAIYGTSFTTAGRAVLRMVNEEGLMTILQSIVADRVVSYGVFFGTLVGGASGFCAMYALYGTHAFDAPAVGVAPALLLSLLLAHTCLRPVHAAIRTSLVCFAEAPSVLRTRDEKLHAAFVELQVKPDPNAPQTATAVGVPVAQPGAMV